MNLASRLTWIMLYFYDAMSHYSLWVSVTQRGGRDWIISLQSLDEFFPVLASLPNIWLAQGTDIVIDDSAQQQMIPAEAPLELVAEIHLNVHDAVNHLRDPGKTMLSWSLCKPEAASRPELI